MLEPQAIASQGPDFSPLVMGYWPVTATAGTEQGHSGQHGQRERCHPQVGGMRKRAAHHGCR